MALPWRSTVTIDGTGFNAVSCKVSFDTAKDTNGVPVMGSLATTIEVLADLQDTKNMPFDTIKKLFNLAKVPTKESIKPIKIEFWQDDNHKDAICSYTFPGWISKFETSNPLPKPAEPSIPQQLLVLHLVPSLTDANFGSLSISN